MKKHWVNRAISNFASLFVEQDAPAPEKRSVGLDNSQGLMRIFPGLANNPNVTTETVKGITALWRALDILGSAFAGLPVTVYTRNRGKIDRLENHPAAIVMNVRPNYEQIPFIFWYSMLTNALLKGGGGAEILKDDRGQVTGLRLMRHGCQPYKPFVDSELMYWDNETGKMYFPDEVFYLPGLMVTDGTKATSLLEAFKNEFGTELSAILMGRHYMQNATSLTGWIEQSIDARKSLSPEAKNQVEQDWKMKYGGVDNAGEVAFLDMGLKFHPLQPANMRDATYVDIRKFNVASVARMTGVSADMLMETDKQSYSFSTESTQRFFMWTLDPWLTKRDQEARIKLLSANEQGRLKIETEVDETMWMLPEKRVEYWNKLFQMGAMSPNDILSYLNRNSIEGGDDYFIQQNLIALKNAHLLGPNNTSNGQRKKRSNDPGQTELFSDEQPGEAANG
jgi:HK97 family phage portal protein